MSKSQANSPKGPRFEPKWSTDWATRVLYPEPDFAEGRLSSSVKAFSGSQSCLPVNSEHLGNMSTARRSQIKLPVQVGGPSLHKMRV